MTGLKLLERLRAYPLRGPCDHYYRKAILQIGSLLSGQGREWILQEAYRRPGSYGLNRSPVDLTCDSRQESTVFVAMPSIIF